MSSSFNVRWAILAALMVFTVAGCGQQAVHFTNPACDDAKKNGAETDVDCGGGTCGGCDDGKACLQGADCKSGTCINGKCGPLPATCADTVKNGDETDVDCGGRACLGCADGKRCAVDMDCRSGLCDNGVCAAGACMDQKQDGAETDVDCGGRVCPKCEVGQRCNRGDDCKSGACSNNVCTASCADGVKNGEETDVDCGGTMCGGCADGMICLLGRDCINKVCDLNSCKPPTCTDQVKNGDETDIDCGGKTCAACPDMQGCKSGKDCKNGICVNGMCQPPSCADQVKNGNETDVDCGGNGCPPCGPGKGCLIPGDCWNNVCNMNICGTDAVIPVGNGMGQAPFDPKGDGSKLVTVDGNGAITVDRQTSLLNIARFIYVSNSGEGTVSKIDPNTQKEVARYCTAPGCNADPSRASVSLDGDAGIANRANYFYGGVVHPERASAVKIAGDISRCVDRNGNGKIDTNLMPGAVPMQFQWPSNTTVSPDECVLWWTPLIRDRNGNYVGGAGTLPRSATWDSKASPDGSLSSNFYVGLYGTAELAQLDAKTGAIKQQIAIGGQAYSSVFDRFGYLWIRDAVTSRMIRVDTNQANLPATFVGPAAPCAYAITADRRGYIYSSGSNCVSRMDPGAMNPAWETLALPNACSTRGPSLDADFNLWVPDTCYGAYHVDASKPVGMGMTLKKQIPLQANSAAYILGTAIDGNAYPWFINTETGSLQQVGGPAGTVYRLDPKNNYAITQVRTGASPYVYSDLSGSQLALTAPTTGSYRKTFTAWCGNKATWTTLTWADMVPPGTSVLIRYRAAKDQASLANAPFVGAGAEPPAVAQPAPIKLLMGTDPTLFQVEFVISTSDTQNKPTLSSVSVAYTCPK